MVHKIGSEVETTNQMQKMMDRPLEESSVVLVFVDWFLELKVEHRSAERTCSELHFRNGVAVLPGPPEAEGDRAESGQVIVVCTLACCLAREIDSPLVPLSRVAAEEQRHTEGTMHASAEVKDAIHEAESAVEEYSEYLQQVARIRRREMQ